MKRSKEHTIKTICLACNTVEMQYRSRRLPNRCSPIYRRCDRCIKYYNNLNTI